MLGSMPKHGDCEQKRAKQEVPGLCPQFTKEEQDLICAVLALLSHHSLKIRLLQESSPDFEPGVGSQPQV